MSSKILINNCHQQLSPTIVIKNCHQKLSSKIVIKNCHQQLSSTIVINNCHQCLKGHRSLGSLFNVKNKQKVGQLVSEWVSEWVSQWQGHLLSCQVTAKKALLSSEVKTEMTPCLKIIFFYAKNAGSVPKLKFLSFSLFTEDLEAVNTILWAF